MDDTRLLAEFLSRRRFKLGKTRAEIALRIGRITGATVSNWEREGIFPKPERLDSIALAYEVSLTDVIEIWQTSKNAHRKMVLAGKNNRSKKRDDNGLFSGEIGNLRQTARTNGILLRDRGISLSRRRF